jgi:hypothetical protein
MLVILLHKIAEDTALLQQQQTTATAELQAKEACTAAHKLLTEEDTAAGTLIADNEHAGQVLKQVVGSLIARSVEATTVDGEDVSMAVENNAGMGKGSYPKQDINKTIDYLRSYGMGCGWNNRKELPEELPTFYVDDDNNMEMLPPPPPSNAPPSLTHVKYEMQQQGQKDAAPIAAKKRKRRVHRKRVPVKVEKHDKDDESDDVDSDVELVATKTRCPTPVYKSRYNTTCHCCNYGRRLRSALSIKICNYRRHDGSICAQKPMHARTKGLHKCKCTLFYLLPEK